MFLESFRSSKYLDPMANFEPKKIIDESYIKTRLNPNKTTFICKYFIKYFETSVLVID